MSFLRLKADAIDVGHRATHGYLTMISFIGAAATAAYALSGAWTFAAVSAVATVCFATGAALVQRGNLEGGVDVGIVLSSALLLGMLTSVYVLFPDGVDEGQTLVATAFYLIATAGFFARRYYQVIVVVVPAGLLVIAYFFVLARPEQLELRNLLVAATSILMAVGSTLIFRQADALRKTQSDLEAMNRDLSNALQIKDRFLANMSHEIRTPLSGMIGSADLLAREGPREDQCETIEALRKSGASLLRIVEDILNIAKLDADEYEFENAALSVAEVVSETVALYRVAAYAKGIALDSSIDPGTPDQVVGDRERIKQILGNLVSNAVKYTERGSVSVDVAGERSSPWQLVLTVRDTGIGIAVEDQPRLFRLFEQLDSSYAKRHFGTGLGLALTKRLVESAGGSIHVESSPGVGTSFTVRVPLILPLELPTDSSTVSKQGATPTAKAAATRGVQTKRPPRVLVAEDEPINATILQRSLESIDVVVCQAENGREAIGRLSEFEPDIIIMDAQMPEMSGVEATWHIRSLPPPLGTIPIIGLTAYSHDHDVQNLLDAGMNECHTKPLDLKVLEKTLHRHLPGLFQEQVS